MYPASVATALSNPARILRRHQRKMAFFFIAVTAIVVTLAVLTPRSFRSQAELLVRLGRENVTVDPTATAGQAPVVAVPVSRENEINSAIQILKSPVIIEKVVNTLGASVVLDKAPLPAEGGKQAGGRADSDTPAEEHYRAVRKVAKSLSVEAVKKSNMILIGYQGSSPELCQAVVARLIDFYLDRHVTLNRTPGAHQFFKEQTDRLRGKLAHTEAELRDLQDATGLSSPEAQRQIIVNRIGRLQDELMQAAALAAATEAEARFLTEKLASLPKTQVTAQLKNAPNHAADLMQGQLFAFQIKERELLTKYPDQHPEMKELRQQIESTKADLDKVEAGREQVTTGPNRVFEEAQLALLKQEPVRASLKARADTLRNQLVEEQGKLKALNEDCMRVQALQREFKLQEAAYLKYAENLEHSQIDRALEAERITNISIAQPATFDPQPVGLPRPLMLVLGLLFALIGSVALAFLLEYRDHSVKGSEELEHTLELPVGPEARQVIGRA